MWRPNPEPGGAGIMAAAALQLGRLSVGAVGGGHMKRNCPKCAEEKENKKKDRKDA